VPGIPGSTVELDLAKAEDGATPVKFESRRPAVMSEIVGDPALEPVVRDHNLNLRPHRRRLSSHLLQT
jgi:hypothetical protein